MISIHQQSGKIDAYIAAPQKAIKYRGAVIVVHEIWGLTDHIKQVATRLAAHGYYTLAPDLYSSGMANRRPSESLQKDMFSDDEKIRYAAQPKLRALIGPTQTPQFTSLAISRLASCFEYMYNQPLSHQKVGLVGFGMGGTYAYGMAIRESRLRAVVSFYGHAQYIEQELRHIHCPIMGLYGEKEPAALKDSERLLLRMKAAGVDFDRVIYEGVGHAFFNDTNQLAYRSVAADDAWRRTLTFLHNNL